MSDATREAEIGECWDAFVEAVSGLLYYDIDPLEMTKLVEVMAENERAEKAMERLHS
jgi:hypothetical protein